MPKPDFLKKMIELDSSQESFCCQLSSFMDDSS